MRRYGSDPGVIGHAVRLDVPRLYDRRRPLPPDFDFGESAEHIDIWTPLVVDNASGLGTLHMLARLKPGITLEAARSAMDAEAKHLDQTIRPHYGPNGEDPGFRVKLIPLRDEILGDFRTAALVLMLATSLTIMMINPAQTSLANPIAGQGRRASNEIAARRRAGCIRKANLLRQWMTESAVLAAFGVERWEHWLTM